MKNITYAGILGALLMSGNNASAQSIPFEGVYFNGFVDYEYAMFFGTSSEILSAELNMGFAPRNFGSSMAVGFDMGIDVLDFSVIPSVISTVVLYPSLVIDSTYGRFSIGLPRSVIDSYISRPSFANSSADNFILNVTRRSFMLASNLLSPNFHTEYGIRYDGQIGNTEFGASYHKTIDSGTDIHVYGLAERHKIGMTQLFGGIEFVNVVGVFSVEHVYVGFETEYDQFSGGAIHSSASSETHVFANYHMTDQIEFNASIWNLSKGSQTRTNRVQDSMLS